MGMETLESLAGMAAEVDAMGGPTPEQVEQETKAQQAEAGARSWGQIAFTIGSALSMFAPELAQVYTEDACLRWGESANAVGEKYGWHGTDKLPELGLLLSTVALVAPTVIVIRHRLKNPEPDGRGGGMLAAVRAWWREKRAKRAAEVVNDAAGQVQQAAAMQAAG